MKICVVHNEYSKLSGEEVMINKIIKMLEDHNHSVTCFKRSSTDISKMRFGTLRAFFSGIHSPGAVRDIKKHLAQNKPDVVLIQNVFPFISTGVFNVVKRCGIPLVFRCGNFRLFCPTGLLLSHGKICEKCVGGKEYWCVLKNCENWLPKSFGYALRTAWMRVTGNVIRNTDMYITQNSFTKGKFVEWGLPAERIEVIPNFVGQRPQSRGRTASGDFVGFVGRISPEKDILSVLSTARRLEYIPFKLAGDYSRMPQIAKNAPPNVKFLGHLSSKSLQDFYSNCRFIVLSSNCYEVFPVVLIEAMAQGKPIICSRIGGLPEIVEDKHTGLLFEPGSVGELTRTIQYLWNQPEICEWMGQRGREKVMREYTAEKHYEQLMAVFERAINLNAESLT